MFGPFTCKQQVKPIMGWFILSEIEKKKKHTSTCTHSQKSQNFAGKFVIKVFWLLNSLEPLHISVAMYGSHKFMDLISHEMYIYKLDVVLSRSIFVCISVCQSKNLFTQIWVKVYLEHPIYTFSFIKSALIKVYTSITQLRTQNVLYFSIWFKKNEKYINYRKERWVAHIHIL